MLSQRRVVPAAKGCSGKHETVLRAEENMGSSLREGKQLSPLKSELLTMMVVKKMVPMDSGTKIFSLGWLYPSKSMRARRCFSQLSAISRARHRPTNNATSCRTLGIQTSPFKLLSLFSPGPP